MGLVSVLWLPRSWSCNCQSKVGLQYHRVRRAEELFGDQPERARDGPGGCWHNRARYRQSSPMMTSMISDVGRWITRGRRLLPLVAPGLAVALVTALAQSRERSSNITIVAS